MILQERRLVAKIIAAGLVGLTTGLHAGWSDVPREVRGQIVSAVAMVGSVWADDDLLGQFHQSLAERYKDVPGPERFKAEEQWVSTYSSRGVRFPGVFNARAGKDMKVKVGDIVRVRVEDYRRVDSYYRTSSVEVVLCRVDDPGFDACAQRMPLGWTLKSGQEVRR